MGVSCTCGRERETKKLLCMALYAVNVDTICATIRQVATDRCTEMEDMAQSVANKNGRVLLLFSKCDEKFNSQQKVTDEMLVELHTFNALAQ